MSRILLAIFLLCSLIASGQTVQTPALATSQQPILHSQTQLPLNQILWDEKEPFVNGYARVLSRNKFSFVNRAGNLICDLQFDGARNFTNKLVAVKKASKWGFMNESGKIVIPCRYDIVFDFKESVTAVFADKRWSLINTKGALIRSLDITAFFGFNNGSAKIIKDGKTGSMNTRGEIILSNENANPPSQRSNSPVANAVTSICPDNIDFENGNFSNWKCFTGDVDSIGATNSITVVPSPPIPNRHTIINRSMPSGIDPFGLFPTNPPDGSDHAVKLGNTMIGAEAERIQYTIRVPLNDSNFSIKYDYAVVFEDPGHTAWTQPRFIARLFDSAANAYIECASFEYISTSSLPGFAVSGVDTTVIYKPWSTVFISLRNYPGRTLFLEFTTADCVRRGHWGYAYVDVESTCGHSVDLQYDCNTSIATLTAPPGFQTYNWWNVDFTTLLATGEQVVLDPGPHVDSTLYLEMIPFNEFGCRDTMPVQITGTFTAHFDASETNVNCAPHRFTFYNTNLPSTSVTWDFGDGNTGAGDTVSHTFMLPGTYVVTMTVTLPSGCTASTQETIRIRLSTAAFSYASGNFCNSQVVQFDVTGSNFNFLIWNFGDGTVVTTTDLSITHTYTTPGIYIPNLAIGSVGGCEVAVPGNDTIRIEQLDGGFTHTIQRSCGSTRVNFTDTSHALFGIASYDWDFGDGTTGTGNTTSHDYTTTGSYNVQLIITGVTGCKDTIIKPVNIIVNNIPVAPITGPSIECPNVPVTFSSVVQSADPVSSMEWTVSNGDHGSGNTITVNFTTPGDYDVQLITETVNGCFDTTTHQITIRSTPIVDQPASQELCNGANSTAIHFTGSVSTATYNWTNNEPGIGLAATGTGDIPVFTAINTSGIAITATITVTAANAGCPGNPETFTITVNSIPTVSQPADQTVCNGVLTTGVSLTSFTSAVTNASYSWTNNLPSIGLPASGTGNIPSFYALNNTSSPITATITITPTNNGCPGIPSSFNITVNPTPDVLPPADLTFCNGSASAAINFTSNVSGTTFYWTNDLPSMGIAGSGSDSIGAFTAINPTHDPVTATIAVEPSFNGCVGIPQFFAVTVNPTPDVNQPANQSLCNGSSTTSIAFNGAATGTIFTWTNDLTSIGLPANGTGNIPSFNPNNGTSVSVTATITVTPMANNCPGIAKDFTITILPSPAVIQPLNLFLCNGETAPITPFTSPVSGASFTWTNSLPSIGLAASGSGSIPSFNATNNTNVPLVASITVTASTNTCPGLSRTFYITVDPTPNMSPVQNQTVCNGDMVDPVNFTGTVNGTTYTWINNLTSIGLAANGTGNIAAFTAVNNTNFPMSAIIYVTGTANSCGSTTGIFTITVNPSPNIDVPDDVALCNGASTNPIHLTGPVSGTSFSWTNNKPSIGLAASGTGDIPAFTTVNNTSVPIVATITVMGTSNSCGDAGRTFTITVHPTPAVVANNNMNVCLGNEVHLLASGAAFYSWSPSTGLSCVDCPNPVVTPTDSISYGVKGVSNFGCTGFDTVRLEVKKPFEMQVLPSDTLCAGESTLLKAIHANNYLWSPPTGLNRVDVAEPTATPLTTTTYRVIGYDGFHCFTDTGYVTVTVGPRPTVNIGPDINANTGNVVTLHPTTQNGPIVSWQWSPAAGLSCNDCPNPTTTVVTGGTYSVTVQNTYGCIATDIITINGFCEKAQVFIPNAFTPDGDGLNDILMVRGGGIRVKSFRIFNRWGELVFEKLNFGANDVKYGWDGKVRGVPATPDVFVYTAEVLCDNNVVYILKGNTTILK